MTCSAAVLWFWAVCSITACRVDCMAACTCMCFAMLLCGLASAPASALPIPLAPCNFRCDVPICAASDASLLPQEERRARIQAALRAQEEENRRLAVERKRKLDEEAKKVRRGVCWKCVRRGSRIGGWPWGALHLASASWMRRPKR